MRETVITCDRCGRQDTRPADRVSDRETGNVISVQLEPCGGPIDLCSVCRTGLNKVVDLWVEKKCKVVVTEPLIHIEEKTLNPTGEDGGAFDEDEEEVQAK